MTLPTHYTLTEAASEFFPSGKITARSLYTEILKGRLPHARIAGKYVVTEDDIRSMIEACRPCRDDAESQPASTSEPAPDASPNGSSVTEVLSTRRDAVEMSIEALKKPSRDTSRRSTSRRPDRPGSTA